MKNYPNTSNVTLKQESCFVPQVLPPNDLRYPKQVQVKKWGMSFIDFFVLDFFIILILRLATGGDGSVVQDGTGKSFNA